MEEIVVSREIYGKQFKLASGLLAKQANGAVMTSIESTQVLSTATMSKETPTADFFPLSVHYNEKFYASGRIPGGFFKREAKPTDGEILICRMIDRPLRPLFPEGFVSEVQITSTTMSIDRINPSDIAGMNGASAALVISDIPFRTPVGAVRIGYVEEEFVVNPTLEEMENSQMELVVAGTSKAVTMIEGDCNEFSEEKILEAIELAHKAIIEIVDLQKELQEKVGKEKLEVTLYKVDETLKASLLKEYTDRLDSALKNPDKISREADVEAIFLAAETKYSEGIEDKEEKISQIKKIMHDLEAQLVRTDIIENAHRSDNRALNELRPIDCRVDILNNVHGSALFTRGQTQSLSVTTIASAKNYQIIDAIAGETKKKFFLHYNFPPFSVGETGRIGPVGRREIGHGMLAERSIHRIMPSLEDFAFTARVVSEILESNGSSSMATICASSMSLMAAGVPVKKPVAGIAMGLIKEGEKYQILTDIQGLEDHLGDMDFKVAGTEVGITGFQLDIKIEGITMEIMAKALAQAKEARLIILDKMKEAIDKPRTSLNQNAPRTKVIEIPVDKVRNVIGPGGKNIKFIVEETSSDIDINDEGKVTIFALGEEKLKKTIELIEKYTGIAKVGQIYEGKVKKITNFGAFVEILPGTDGLVHISELSHKRVNRVEDVINEGNIIKVKVIKVDEQGRVNLSLKKTFSRENE